MLYIEMDNYTGAAGAFYYIENGRTYSLMGKESRYVKDYIALPVGANNEPRIIINPETREPFTPDTLRAYEAYAVADGTTMFHVHAEFARRARALTRLNHTTIRYDLPHVVSELQDGRKVYKVHYRMLFEVPATPKEPMRPIQYGVVKGRRESSDRSALHTLERELYEETGITMRINPRVPTTHRYNTIVYYIDLTGTDIRRLKEQIADKNSSSYGELFGLKFMEVYEPAHYITHTQVNTITRHVINNMP